MAVNAITLALWTIGQVLMLVGGVFGNVLTWRACRLPDLATSSAYYIVRVVAALDIFSVLLFLPSDVVAPLTLQLLGRSTPSLFCPAVQSVQDAVMRASIVGQLLLAANRFLAVFQPLRYRVIGRRAWNVSWLMLNVPSLAVVFVQVRRLVLNDC